MKFDVKRIALIVAAALLAVVLVVLVVIALSGLGNRGENVTQPTTAPTQPSTPPADKVIETPYGNMVFPGEYAPYLQVERVEQPELTLNFIAKTESGRTQPLFDLRFGEAMEPAIGQVISDDGVAVGVYLTVHSFSPDGSWSLKDRTLVAEMLEQVNDLVDQLMLLPLGSPVPDVQDGEIVIDTPYCKLYFPERWKEDLRIAVTQTKGYEVVFSGDIGEHKGVKLFAVNFGGGEDTGKIAHTIMTNKGVALHIYVRTYTLETEGWSSLDVNTAKTMQEDLNHLLSKLIEE